MKDLLIDTHVLIWFLEEDKRLTPVVLQHIQDATRVYVSAASVWEIAIKSAKGKLEFASDFLPHIKANHFLELPVLFAHAKKAAELPLLHKDPFDRLLVAQALCERLAIVTGDRHIQLYGAKVIAA